MGPQGDGAGSIRDGGDSVPGAHEHDAAGEVAADVGLHDGRVLVEERHHLPRHRPGLLRVAPSNLHE
jgi:hypothetical protein